MQNYLLSFPDINWNDYSASNSVSVTFCDIIFYLNLTQLVTKPTHVHGNILDVVLSNFDLSDGPNIIDKLPLGLSSDHHIICFSISDIARTHTVSTPKVLLDYSKANWNGMNLFFLTIISFKSINPTTLNLFGHISSRLYIKHLSLMFLNSLLNNISNLFGSIQK